MPWDPQVLSWTSTGETRDEKIWHFKKLCVYDSLQCKLQNMRLLHQESLETIVIFQSAFKCLHKIGLPYISLCNYLFSLFAPHLFFLWPVFLLPKLISLFFLTKNYKSVPFLGVLIAIRLFQFFGEKRKFSMRFPSNAVLLSLIALNMIIRIYTVVLTFFGFCPHNSWMHLNIHKQNTHMHTWGKCKHNNDFRIKIIFLFSA